MAAGINGLKPSSERKPLLSKELRSKSYDKWLTYKCRSAIKKHHELLKDDPERLTTEFLLEITNCACKRRKNHGDSEINERL